MRVFALSLPGTNVAPCSIRAVAAREQYSLLAERSRGTSNPLCGRGLSVAARRARKRQNPFFLFRDRVASFCQSHARSLRMIAKSGTANIEERPGDERERAGYHVGRWASRAPCRRRERVSTSQWASTAAGAPPVSRVRRRHGSEAQGEWPRGRSLRGAKLAAA